MEIKKFLDQDGLIFLWSQISMADYPNNETLVSILNVIDETKADKNEIPTMDEIYENISARFDNAEDVSF